MMINDNAIQAQKGKEKVTGGTFKGVQQFCCTGDGDLEILYAGGSETVSYVQGESRSLGGIDVTVKSGSFTVN